MADLPFGLDLDTVKAFLGHPTGSPTDTSRDAILTFWLNSAVEMVQIATGRNLYKATYRDTFQAKPEHLYLQEFPIIQTLSVSSGNSVLPAVDYQVFAATGRIQFNNHRYYRNWDFREKFNYLVIDYVGGYDVLPSTLQMAIFVGIQAAEQANKQMNQFGGIAKQLTVVDVGSTTLATRPNFTSAAMQQAISENLSDYLGQMTTQGLGTWDLRETERIADAPGSP